MKAAHNEHLFIELIEKGFLKIDNDGKIWRLGRKYKNKPVIKTKKRKLNYICRHGYIHPSIGVNGKTFSCLAHRLVWIYHNGKIPDNVEINHKNGIKTDNRIENLELLTRSENIIHAFKNGIMKGLKGENHPAAKLKDEDIKQIRTRCKNGELHKNIAKDYNVNVAHISKIKRKELWGHL